MKQVETVKRVSLKAVLALCYRQRYDKFFLTTPSLGSSVVPCHLFCKGSFAYVLAQQAISSLEKT